MYTDGFSLLKFLTSIFENQLLFTFLLGCVVYIFFLAPRLEERENQHVFHQKMKVGDKVVTLGGIYAKILKIEDARVTVEVDQTGSYLVLDKEAIFSRPKPVSRPEKASKP